MTPGQYLKKIRNQCGLTISEVADNSKGILDKTAISRIERDERGLSLKAAFAFSRTYNIQMETIMHFIVKDKPNAIRETFETSLEERRFIEMYRLLPKDRKIVFQEISRGLAIVAENGAPPETRKKLKTVIDDFRAAR